LRTLGINPQVWTFAPSLAASLIAGPVLTVIGTFLALCIGSHVGPSNGIGSSSNYWKEVRSTVFPRLRLRAFVPLQAKNSTSTILDAVWYNPDYRTTYSADFTDTVVEIVTYPVVYHLFKAVTFMMIIMGVAEVCARIQSNLTPRGIPSVITRSVVTAGLLVILADWGFSQLWLRRY